MLYTSPLAPITSNTHMETDWAEASGAAMARDKAARDLRIMTTSGSFLCFLVCKAELSERPASEQAFQIHGFNVLGIALRAHLAEEASWCAVAVVGAPVLVRRELDNPAGHFVHQLVLLPHIDAFFRLGEFRNGLGQYLRSAKGFGSNHLNGIRGSNTRLNTQLRAVFQHLPGVWRQVRAGVRQQQPDQCANSIGQTAPFFVIHTLGCTLGLGRNVAGNTGQGAGV